METTKETIKSIFEEECKDLVIDAKLCKKIAEYRLAFINKNPDHIDFFGGNLLGVQVVRFVQADQDKWFDEILEVNDSILESRLHELPTLDPEHMKVASDVMNLSCAWLLHALAVSPHLNERQKHDAMIDVAQVLQYKFLTSRLYRHFKYAANEATAKATYASLSLKFAIKQHQTWDKVLLARSEEIISKSGIHALAVYKMDDDTRVIYLLNDSQGRIRDMIKNIYDVFLRTHAQGDKVISTSSVIEHDGESMLKDRSKSILTYSRYLESIITDRRSFIREDLMMVIEKMMRTMGPRPFKMTLEWMSDNYRQRGAQDIEMIVKEVIVHAFDYMSQNRSIIRSSSDLPVVLSKLRGAYMASRGTDPSLMLLRDKTEHIVRLATGMKHDGNVKAVRTGILLYLVARALTMKHYANT